MASWRAGWQTSLRVIVFVKKTKEGKEWNTYPTTNWPVSTSSWTKMKKYTFKITWRHTQGDLLNQYGMRLLKVTV